MPKRKIIKIDLDKCNGCGDCIPGCPEGAIQLIDGKARLISDLFCDGLGACLGTCPVAAISIEERQAEEYEEKKVMANIVKQGPNTIKAHLEHLKSHGQKKYLDQALEFLKEQKIDLPKVEASHGCPGMKMMDFSDKPQTPASRGGQPSALRQWPIQLHLVSPLALYFQGKDVLLSADCVAYSLGGFHAQYLLGKSLAIACPKLDSNKDVYIEKIKMLADQAKINTLTVMIMEVPCCGGLLALAKEGLSQAKRKVPLKLMVVGIKGDIMSEEWVTL
ncbi:MAG: 4Fe-4S dicluster domain-containing protein [Candidatus Omnitrophica bacterium]|nr:4Fe-4S dicluster domain-containing protein [Candidatus Omnitrophota bacterium]MBU2043633.1 4Fe-4S dicluster domain-containing protein [Candidatus Omnitrophota bacterium]MBU2251011.1 4Fe-4S dicluster domain-containing protein [Candidatus Omnitrophota bacterium]MBU2265789.1 4Fe-4S dicluster domain-containing protein [Candidatus Omnitrophota bacterium]